MEEVEPPGRGGAAGSGARPPAPTPLRCLSLGGDTKSSRSEPSAWRRCPTGSAERGGQVGRLPKGRAGSRGAGADAAFPAPAPQPAARV